MSLFGKPNYEKDEKLLKSEQAKMQGKIDWSEKYWKPVPHEENAVRVMPPRSNSDATYHKKISKHFIRHPDKTEVFTCMKEVYGEPCPACDEWQRLLKEAGKEKNPTIRQELKDEARRFKPQRFGVFNIVSVEYDKDGNRVVPKDAKVKLYESPMTIWQKIISIVSTRSRMSDIFDEFKNDKGEIEKPGRDIIITYDPDQTPQNRYNAYPTDRVAMGTPEQVLEWYEQITDLESENISFRVEYDVAQIKTFGNKEEREELREVLKQIYAEKFAKEEVGNVKEEDKELIDGLKSKVREEKVEEKKKVENDGDVSSIDRVKQKLQEIKNRNRG